LTKNYTGITQELHQVKIPFDVASFFGLGWLSFKRNGVSFTPIFTIVPIAIAKLAKPAII
jgi:hypothetical protein